MGAKRKKPDLKLVKSDRPLTLLEEVEMAKLASDKEITKIHDVKSLIAYLRKRAPTEPVFVFAKDHVPTVMEVDSKGETTELPIRANRMINFKLEFPLI